MLEVRTARAEEYGELMALLDDVFFFDDDSQPPKDFLSELPKLYRERYKPWEKNYCVFEDGRMVAAVGMYVAEAEIAGEALRVGGIGNVAVARDCRRKGYMKLAMNAAMDAMRDAGCAFGALGGQRQRYQFWGFECCGAAVSAAFNEKNLRHAYGDNPLDPAWRAAEILPGDAETLAKVQALAEAAPVHIRHDPAAMHDVLCSWRRTPYAIWRGGELCGFFTMARDGGSVSQFVLPDHGHLEMALRAAFTALPGGRRHMRVSVPMWQGELIALAEEIAEDGFYRDGDTGMFNVLSWERTLRALMRLQADCKRLPKGSLTVRIHGFNGDETLRLSVSDGYPLVKPFIGSKPQLELTQLQALRFFLASYSVTRRDIPLADAWFPLPLYVYEMDGV